MDGSSGLSRRSGSRETREAMRTLGGLLIGLGLVMVSIRKGTGLEDRWGDWALFATLLIAFVFLYGVGMLGGWGTRGPRPWQSVYIVFAVFLAPLVLRQLVEALDGAPGDSVSVLWIFGVTAGLAASAALIVGVRYGLLLASVAWIVSWSALWDELLSGGLEAHFGVYRGLLLVGATLLLCAALALHLADRGGRLGGRAAGAAAPELAGSRANEIVTGAALAAVVAGGLGLTRLLESPLVSIPTADSSLPWELVLLAASLLAVGWGSRFGARGAAYVGGIGLLGFLLIAGLDLNDSTARRDIVGWPLALVVVGAVAFAASLVPGRRSSGEAHPIPTSARSERR